MSTFSELEVPIRDAERLAVVIRELFLARIAGVEINLQQDEHDYMMETLLDRLCDLSKTITKDYYKAFEERKKP